MGKMHDLSTAAANLSEFRVAPVPVTPEMSFVIPAFNEAATIDETLRRVADKVLELGLTAEIVVVDDGSADSTAEAVCAHQCVLPLRLLRLSRNFGKEQAIMAGLRHAAGDAILVLDADLQEPLRYVDEMLAHYRDGYEMVYSVRAHRADEGVIKRAFTGLFYKFLNAGSEVPMPAGARDFRLMDRKVVDALCSLPEKNRFMKGLYAWVGFRSIAVPVELEPRAGGASKFGFRSLLRHGMTGLTAFTNWPLRMWTAIGMVLAVLSLLYGLFIAARTMIWGHDLPGWSTLAVAIFFLGGIQLISIGVLGEYLARVFSEVKGRPGFLIAEDVAVEPRS